MPHRWWATDVALRSRRSTFLRDDTGRMAMSNSALDSPTGRLPEDPATHFDHLFGHAILRRLERESEVVRSIMSMDFTLAEARIIAAYAAPAKPRREHWFVRVLAWIARCG